MKNKCIFMRYIKRDMNTLPTRERPYVKLNILKEEASHNVKHDANERCNNKDCYFDLIVMLIILLLFIGAANYYFYLKYACSEDILNYVRNTTMITNERMLHCLTMP